MEKERLEYFAKQAIERVIAYLESYKLRESPIEKIVYSDDCHGYQVGFYIYYDYEIKDFRIYALACNREGFAARRARYYRQELCLNTDFVAALVDEYIYLMEEADISERE